VSDLAEFAKKGVPIFGSQWGQEVELGEGPGEGSVLDEKYGKCRIALSKSAGLLMALRIAKR